MGLSDYLILAVLIAGMALYLRFLVTYAWTFPTEQSLDGWALMSSAIGWIVLLGGLLVDTFAWDFPSWLWLALVAPPVLLSGILKNLLLNDARRKARRVRDEAERP